MNRLLKNISLVCLGMALVIGALSSCGDKELEEGRNDVENNNSEESGDSEGELVEVHFTARQPGSDDSETRSSFVPGSTRLVWSDYDSLGVYAYETGTASPASSTIATFGGKGNSVGSTSATFTGEMTLTKDKYYRYYAYYPDYSDADKTVNTVKGKTVSFKIERNQSEEFGKYQICYAKSTQHQFVGQTPPTIKFDTFTPATALVRVYPVLDPNLPDETLVLDQLVLGSRNKKLAGKTEFNMETGEWKTGSDAVVNSIKTVEVTKSKGGYFDFVIIPGATGSLSVIDPAHYLAGSIEIDSEIVPGTFYEKTVVISEPKLSIDENNAPQAYASAWGNTLSIYKTYQDSNGKTLAFMHRNFKGAVLEEGRGKMILLGDTGYFVADCFKELRTIVVTDEQTDNFKLYYTGSDAVAKGAKFGNRTCYFPPVGCTGFEIKRGVGDPFEICKGIKLWYEGDPTTEILDIEFHDGTAAKQPFTAALPGWTTEMGDATLPGSNVKVEKLNANGAVLENPSDEQVKAVNYVYTLKSTTYEFKLHAEISDDKKFGQWNAYRISLNSGSNEKPGMGLILGEKSGSYVRFPGIPDKKLVYVDYSTGPGITAEDGTGTVIKAPKDASVEGGNFRAFVTTDRDSATDAPETHKTKYHLRGTLDGVGYRLQVQGDRPLYARSITLIYE